MNSVKKSEYPANTKSVVKRLAFTVAALLFTVFPFILTACDGADTQMKRVVGTVDSVEGYRSVELTAAQSAIAKNCSVKGLYLNGAKQVFYTATTGYGGTLGLAVLINGNIIDRIGVVDDRESPDVGGNCYSEKYLKNIIGVDVTEIIMRNPPELIGGSRPGENVDVIYYTGATLTSKAILAAVNGVVSFRNLHGNLIFGFGNP